MGDNGGGGGGGLRGFFGKRTKKPSVPASAAASGDGSSGGGLALAVSESARDKRLKRKENNEFSRVEARMPREVSDSLDWLVAHAAEQIEGIFRISGEHDRIQRIHAMYVKGRKKIDLDALSGGSPHVVSGVLKLYLRELPVPLLTFEFYDAFLEAMKPREEADRILNVKTILPLLPPGNRTMLQALLGFAAKIAACSAKNLMSARNLAIVFSACMLRSQSTNLVAQLSEGEVASNLVEMMIDRYAAVFLEESSKDSMRGTLRNKAFYMTVKKGTVRLAASLQVEKNARKRSKTDASAGPASGALSDASSAVPAAAAATASAAPSAISGCSDSDDICVLTDPSVGAFGAVPDLSNTGSGGSGGSGGGVSSARGMSKRGNILDSVFFAPPPSSDADAPPAAENPTPPPPLPPRTPSIPLSLSETSRSARYVEEDDEEEEDEEEEDDDEEDPFDSRRGRHGAGRVVARGGDHASATTCDDALLSFSPHELSLIAANMAAISAVGDDSGGADLGGSDGEEDDDETRERCIDILLSSGN